MTEHQLIERECGCGYRTRGIAPAGAEAPVQYGPRIAAVIVYMYAGQFLSKDRTAAVVCGSPSTRVELVALGELPAEWEQRDTRQQSSFLLHRDPERWHLFKGVAAYNDGGDPIDASKAELIAEAFGLPCPSPKFTPPDSTTMQGSAPTAALSTATVLARL